jgi:hypothetical protein
MGSMWCFQAVTRISARRHLWGYKFKSWYFGFGLVFRARGWSLKVEDDLRTSIWDIY